MLRKTLSLVAVSMLLATISCNNAGSAKITEEDMKIIEAEKELANKLPKVEFDKMEHDFGMIEANAKVETEFIVKNVGEADLLISNATATCGCIVPDYPKQPLKPGESAPIKVTFDPAGKSGIQSKTVTLTTNTEKGTETFTIKADVKAGEGTTPAKSRTKTIIN
jgi:hypothetical protein